MANQPVLDLRVALKISVAYKVNNSHPPDCAHITNKRRADCFSTVLNKDNYCLVFRLIERRYKCS